MYQTSKKKTKKDSRFNNLYILKLNQVDDKHQEWVENSKVRKALSFQDICDGDSWAFLMERRAFSLRCFSKSSKLSSTSLSDS